MLAELFLLLAFGTFWFWAFLIVAFCILTAFVENDKGVGATITLILTVAALQWISHLQILQTILGHPWVTLGFVASYFVVGAFWGYSKWFLFIREQIAKFEEFRLEYIRRRGKLEGKVAQDFKEAVESSSSFDLNPQVTDHKARITRWMTYWPSSLFWFILKDPVRRAFNQIVLALRGSMQRVSDRAYARVKKEHLDPLA